MEKEILLFLENWFNAEIKARNAALQDNRKMALQTLEVMNSYSIKELHNMFHVTPNPIPEHIRKRFETRKFEKKRYIYKLCHYKNKKYNDLFIAWVSGFNPKDHYKVIGAALFIAKVEGKWKIIRLYGFDDDESDAPWYQNTGDRDVGFKTAGKLIEIYRYLEPDGEKTSLFEYRQDY